MVLFVAVLLLLLPQLLIFLQDHVTKMGQAPLISWVHGMVHAPPHMCPTQGTHWEPPRGTPPTSEVSVRMGTSLRWGNWSPPELVSRGTSGAAVAAGQITW